MDSNATLALVKQLGRIADALESIDSTLLDFTEDYFKQTKNNRQADERDGEQSEG